MRNALLSGSLALLALVTTPSVQAAELGSADLPVIQPPFFVGDTSFPLTFDFSVSIGGYGVVSSERFVILDPTATANFLLSPVSADATNNTDFASIAGLLTNGVNDTIQFSEVLWLGAPGLSTGLTRIGSTSEFALFGHDFAGSTISDVQLSFTTPVFLGNPGFQVFGFGSLEVNGMTVTPVPEPETYAMLLVGLGLVGFAIRRRTPKREKFGGRL